MSKLNDALQLSGKRVLISKANSTVLICVSITVAIVVFVGVAGKSLVSKMSYQNTVIEKRQTAADTLKRNVTSAQELNTSYQAFEGAPESVIGTKDKNSKVVLDALPSKYDYPALVTSISELVKGSGAVLSGINGSDAELTAEQSSVDPVPVEIPLDVSVSGNYASIQKLIADFQRSIRPIHLLTVQITGSDDQLQATFKIKTYYQPEKKIDIVPKVVPGPNGTAPAKPTGAAQS